MKKSTISTYEIFVKKLSQKGSKLFTREEIADIWILSGGSKSRISYGLSKAKNSGILESLGGGIFLINNQKKEISTGRNPIDDLYWQMINLLITIHSPSGAIIAHEKSLEYYLRDYSIPDRLVLYTRNTQKRIQIAHYQIDFRIIQTGRKSGTKNMYRLLYEKSRVGEIDALEFRFLGEECSLLDVASLRVHGVGVAENLIIRFLRKYEYSLSREILGELVYHRYIRAINRIRKIAKDHGFHRIYEISLDIIRNEGGGCYLNL